MKFRSLRFAVIGMAAFAGAALAAPGTVYVGRLAWVTNNGGPRKAGRHAGMAAKDEHEEMAERGEVWAIDTATRSVAAKGRRAPRLTLPRWEGAPSYPVMKPLKENCDD